MPKLPFYASCMRRFRGHAPFFNSRQKLLVFLLRGTPQHVEVACDEHDVAHRSAHVQQRYPLQDTVRHLLGWGRGQEHAGRFCYRNDRVRGYKTTMHRYTYMPKRSRTTRKFI